MPQETIVTVHRLDRAEFEKLEKLLPPPIVTEATDAHRAGYLLGIQHVLRLMREGWVVG